MNAGKFTLCARVALKYSLDQPGKEETVFGEAKEELKPQKSRLNLFSLLVLFCDGDVDELMTKE